jgi:hypothetical protein
MERMRAVYAAAELFIRPAPSMPMSWLPNAIDVGPIASRYPDRREELRLRCGVPADRPFALMQFGGFEGFDPLAMWPEQDQVHWLAQDLSGGPRRDATGISSLELRVPDVMSSCDLMLCKPGYGTYSEAAVNRIPVLYVKRGDWPEEAALIPWLAARMPTCEITREDLLAGHLSSDPGVAQRRSTACRGADRHRGGGGSSGPLLERRLVRTGHASWVDHADSTGASLATSVVDGS